MLEILCLVLLSNKNKANALARGRKPGLFVFLTFALWFGLEFVGAMIGISNEMGYGTYALALVLALVGGLASYIIAKTCRRGDYVPETKALTDRVTQNADPLSVPVQIIIIRESSMVGMAVKWSFSLNDQPIGKLGSGDRLFATTLWRQNILRASDAYGSEIKPFLFDVGNGDAEIHFKINKFLPEKSYGILPPTSPGSSPAYPGAGPANAPADTAPVKPEYTEAKFCTSCGEPLVDGAKFCSKCGATRPAVTQNS